MAIASAANAAPSFSKVHAFGDSLSDTGNLSRLSSNSANGIPKQPLAPCFQGRFTNGHVWIQDLSITLAHGQMLPSLPGGTDYAHDGASTGQTLAGASTFILFVRPALGEAGRTPAVASRNGSIILRRARAGVAYAAVSDLEPRELAQFADPWQGD